VNRSKGPKVQGSKGPLAYACVAAIALSLSAACASSPPAVPAARTTPAFADFPTPDVPPSLRASQIDRDQQTSAWRRLQASDLKGATRDYTEILARTPGFYPADAGLGFVALADHQPKTAVTRFRSALARDNRYVPAWRGLVEAEIGAGDDEEAIAALERLIALDPSREADRNRLELLRLKQVQTLIQAGARAREAGRLEEADGLLTRALALSPSSVVILAELSRVEIAKGDLDEAEVHARRAIDVDAGDASAHGALAAVLEARGKTREAVAELAKAAAIDPAAWRDKAAAARAKLEDAAVPPELKTLPAAATVTRGELAAVIGTRLEALLARAPRRVPEVATDARSHWAAAQIVTVTQTGVMTVFPNHTFQPAAPVRRADLAEAVAALVTMAAKGDQLARWQAARPAFADVAGTNLFYRPAALAVAAGVMTADAGRFQPTRPATGAEVLAAIAKIEQMTGK